MKNKYQRALDNIKTAETQPQAGYGIFGNKLSTHYKEEVNLLQELINKETNHKTLEELGYRVYNQDKDVRVYMKTFKKGEEIIHINSDGTFCKVGMEMGDSNLVPITYEELKAIEIKMIELGLCE